MNFMFNEKGIPAPKTILASNPIPSMQYPVIVKPRKGRGSRNVYTISSYHKLVPFIESLDGNKEDWIVQEKIKGAEYTIQVCAAPNLSLVIVAPLLVHEKRGSTIEAELVEDLEIERYCRLIHKNFNPHGCYNVQLIKSDSGIINCFEINPRISTTFCVLLEAGLDPFSLFLEIIH